MLNAVDIPVTIKTRLGVDDHYSFQFMTDFVGRIAESGCSVFIMHARKAILAGLSPKQNRDVPPLHYDWVYQLKKDSQELEIIINGGIDSLESVKQQLEQRSKLERLCRYITRPAVSTKRLSMTRNGRVRYELKTPWRNGTTHVIFEPLDFISRLVSLVPKPRVNLTRFHGVFAPNSKYRSKVTPARRGNQKNPLS